MTLLCWDHCKSAVYGLFLLYHKPQKKERAFSKIVALVKLLKKLWETLYKTPKNGYNKNKKIPDTFKPAP